MKAKGLRYQRTEIEASSVLAFKQQDKINQPVSHLLELFDGQEAEKEAYAHQQNWRAANKTDN